MKKPRNYTKTPMTKKECLKAIKAQQPTHTPGPWTVMEGKTLLHVETANLNDGKPCGMPVCSIPKKRYEDARLIAAAPELLQRLDLMATSFHHNGNHGGYFKDCDSQVCEENREAIARAEGKS